MTGRKPSVPRVSPLAPGAGPASASNRTRAATRAARSTRRPLAARWISLSCLFVLWMFTAHCLHTAVGVSTGDPAAVKSEFWWISDIHWIYTYILYLLYLYIYIYTFIYVSIYIFIYMYIHLYMYIFIYVDIFINIFMYICIFINIFIYIYLYI